MLGRDVTFGQLRDMLETAKQMGVVLSENPLSDPVYADATRDVPDETYYFSDVTEEEIAELESARQERGTKFYLTTDEDGTEVKGLVKEENDTMYMRREGEWIKVNPGDEVEDLDDLPLQQTFGEVVSFWDSQEQPVGAPLKKFEEYL
ncbi:Hypothetical Protein OBI_RACECAR_79 [Arthrobacter phage Racecar]|nr:hypothetical protein PBI_RACECAR_161 [Arthrobacter phage Racecar]QFG12835.1 hypothetical protein PBI_MIMI_158 [Arthrobacter phage Mimi]